MPVSAYTTLFVPMQTKGISSLQVYMCWLSFPSIVSELTGIKSLNTQRGNGQTAGCRIQRTPGTLASRTIKRHLQSEA